MRPYGQNTRAVTAEPLGLFIFLLVCGLFANLCGIYCSLKQTKARFRNQKIILLNTSALEITVVMRHLCLGHDNVRYGNQITTFLKI